MESNFVLLVDDEPFQLKLLQRQLAQNDISGALGCDATSALRRMDEAETAPELVFLDLNMPDMDGVEFLRQLVKREYGGGLVLVSGEDERILDTASRLAHAHRLNVLGHLHKPVDPGALTTLLHRWRTATLPSNRSRRRMYDAEELELAIRRHELVNYYQPKVELSSGHLVGVEALVRWRHPVDGLVTPDQFLDAAEDHHVIDELTRCVLSGAVAQARAWRDEGLDLRVAVNVSMANLMSLDFPDFVLAEILSHGVSPADIILEATESRLIKDVRMALDILLRLRLKQVRLSIDDFGTGHSSLAQLRDLPFHELKIDRGFVSGACHNPTLAAIFMASHRMARELGLTTVAEGVENLDDWTWLRRRGCDLAQGYFIGRPMPAEQIQPWLTEWEERRLTLAGV